MPRNTSLSSSSDRLFKDEELLKKRLQIHYSKLQKLFPLLDGLDFEIPQHVETANLYFPSAFTTQRRKELGLTAAVDIERTLRIPFGHDTLVEVRNSLGFKSILVRHQRNHGGSGVAGFTRRQSLISRTSAQATMHSNVYNVTFKALEALGTEFGLGKPAGALQKLQPSELSTLSEWLEIHRNIKDPVSGKRPLFSEIQPKRLPWFWRIVGGIVDAKDSDDAAATKLKAWNQISLC